MGYSCTVDAGNMLGVIEHFYATKGNPNILTIGAHQYFFERGREQEDGAITGQLMLMLPGDYCQKAGNVRIAPDGTLVRFARIPRTDKQEIISIYNDMQARNPQLLRQWAMGLI